MDEKPETRRRYWELTEARREEARSKGVAQRHFFPHRIRYLPKCGPDGMKLAHRMCGADTPASCWQIVINASASVARRLPAGLFFDDELIWHRQQFGWDGHVASVNIALKDGSAYTMAHFSDVVQRSARKPECRTLINKLFRGWHPMLLNAIGHFCVLKGVERLYTPTSGLSMQHTDRERQVKPQLFTKLYDDDIHKRFAAVRRGDWWCVDIGANAHRLVAPEPREEAVKARRVICLCHDIEHGLGHRDVDPEFAGEADRTAPSHIDAMLGMEAEAGVRASYNVVGALLQEVRGPIERAGHCIGFHSYDHRIGQPQRWQLSMCEKVDYRIKGYRPPQSIVGDDLDGFNLTYFNFDWLASGSRSLRTQAPILHNGLSLIPIHFDDFAMYKSSQSYQQWEARALEEVARRRFTAFSLHDCYARFWLPHYAGLLDRIREMGALATLDEVAEDLALAKAI